MASAAFTPCHQAVEHSSSHRGVLGPQGTYQEVRQTSVPPLSQREHNDRTTMLKVRCQRYFLGGLFQNVIGIAILSPEHMKDTEVTLTLDWYNPVRTELSGLKNWASLDFVDPKRLQVSLDPIRSCPWHAHITCWLFLSTSESHPHGSSSVTIYIFAGWLAELVPLLSCWKFSGRADVLLHPVQLSVINTCTAPVPGPILQNVCT